MSELQPLINTTANLLSSAQTGEDSVALLARYAAEAGQYKTYIPNILNFIWLGDLQEADLSYLAVWRRCNPDMKLQLWTDGSSSLCQYFHSSLKALASSDPQISLSELQINAFDFIYPRVINGETFNSAATDFLSASGMEQSPEISSCEKQNEAFILPDGVVKRAILPLLNRNYTLYRKYYFYEIIIRGNLAAASDIIRLIILHMYGGTYIDIDTLPYFSDLFSRTRKAEVQLSLENNERICLAKSAAFMAWFEKKSNLITDAEAHLTGITLLTEEGFKLLSSSILSDISDIDISKIKMLDNLKVFPSMMLIGAVHFLPGVYYNNLLCCAPGSKLVRLILCNIARRYKLLESHGAIFCLKKNGGDYLRDEIIHGYRHNDKYFSDPVTHWLTGPGVIIDTVIWLAYRIFPVSRALCPEELGEILHGDEFGLTLKQQTLDTPMGLK